MRGALSRIDHFWYRPAPATRLAALRIIIGGFALGYVVIRGPHLMSYADFDASQFESAGVASSLSGTLPDDVVRVLVAITIMAGVAFVTGGGYRLTGPMFAVLLLLVTSYRNSFGQIFHTENLHGVTCDGAGVSPRCRRRAPGRRWAPEPSERRPGERRRCRPRCPGPTRRRLHRHQATKPATAPLPDDR